MGYTITEVDYFLNNINIFIALIIAISVHEFSHALIADRLGDPTPRSMGRLTLNPLAHLDPIGTLMIFIAHFGWGKPVPVDPYNLRHPKRDYALIAMSGPISNLILAIICTILLKFFPILLLVNIVYISLALAIFNLLPFHPLDGSHIFPDLFPENISTIILIFLILPIFNNTALISSLLSPILRFLLGLLSLI